MARPTNSKLSPQAKPPWIKRVPFWVWLFIALSQIVIIGVRPREIREYGQTIEQLSNSPFEARVKNGYEQILWDKIVDLVEAFVVAPVAMLFAYWKWSNRWWQFPRFGLRTFLITVVVLAVALAIWVRFW